MVEALRRLDPLLDVVWNPTAYLDRHGTFDVTGRGTTPPEYAARWQVIRRDKKASLHDDRDYTLVCTVTELDRSGKYPVMLSRGGYAPLGEWLVDYMRLWDAAQSTLADRLAHLHAEHEKIDALTDDSALHQEAAEVIYRRYGGEYWMGRGMGPGTATRATRESSPPPDSSPHDAHDIADLHPAEGRAQTAAALAASTP